MTFGPCRQPQKRTSDTLNMKHIVGVLGRVFGVVGERSKAQHDELCGKMRNAKLKRKSQAAKGGPITTLSNVNNF